MALLDRYVPEYPPDGIHAREGSHQGARPARFSREVFEDYAEKSKVGLRRLVAEAWDTGLDFERAIRELVVHERFISEMDKEIRQQTKLARQAARVAKTNNMGERYFQGALQAAEEGEWLSSVNQPVIQEYQKCRRELERLRDARLREYAAEWEQYLSQLESPVAEDVRRIWAYLSQRLWAPEAAPTDDGFRMVWDRGPHHLQVEVLPGGRYDWFYRDRDTEKLQSEEGLPWGDYSTLFEALIDRISAA